MKLRTAIRLSYLSICGRHPRGSLTKIFSLARVATLDKSVKEKYGAQHSDPWSLVWLIACDKAADGGSQRDPGLSEQDCRTHQSRWYGSSHQAARRGGAPRDLFAQPAWKTGRDNARGCRPFPL